MKRVIIICSLAATLLIGCADYLDSDYLFDERMSVEDVFQSRDYTNRWMARAYSWLNNGYLQDVCDKDMIPFNFADDMFFGGLDNRYKKWKNGQYSESGLNGESENIWKNAYIGIRQSSILLNNIDGNDKFTQEEIDDFKGQAHFLRAYFYWIMLRTYGPVPIVPEQGIDYTLEYDEVAIARNSYEECVDYITAELAAAAATLPLKRDMQNIARPTRGAALALRAKVYLYGASPLYNGKAPADIDADLTDRHGKHLLGERYDESKWAKAAAAAKDVMALNQYQLYVSYFKTTGDAAFPATVAPPHDDRFSDKDWPEGWKNIDPFESYRALFNGAVPAYQNPELIFTRAQNTSGNGINHMIINQLPRVEGKGYNTHGITQKQCDAYYMADGSDCAGMNDMYAGLPAYSGRYNTLPRVTGFVTAGELPDYPELGPLGVNVSKQNAKREPRFYASVAYNGSTWNLLNAQKDKDEVNNVQVFYYRGDGNGYKNSDFWSMTGICVKKYIHPDDMGDSYLNGYSTARLQKKVDPAIRYADILLIYAEALNELTGQYEVPAWDGSAIHTVGRDIQEMKKGIQPVRIRAGLPDYTDDVYADADNFRVKLKRERQIEFFAEQQRYFDLRRWMDAPDEEAAQVYGCNAYSTKEMAELFHTPVPIPSLPTIFARKMWFWPIHHTELRHNKELIQNPGWTYPE
jgi:hypothetical protein